MTKVCTKCGVEKELTDFYKQGKHRRGACKLCDHIRVRSYIGKDKRFRDKLKLDPVRYAEWKSKNAARAKKYDKQGKRKNEKYRATSRARMKELYRMNPDKYKARTTEYLKLQRENVGEQYILALCRTFFGLNAETARSDPFFVKNYIQQIKIKRLLKSKNNNQNGNTKQNPE